MTARVYKLSDYPRPPTEPTLGKQARVLPFKEPKNFLGLTDREVLDLINRDIFKPDYQ